MQSANRVNLPSPRCATDSCPKESVPAARLIPPPCDPDPSEQVADPARRSPARSRPPAVGVRSLACSAVPFLWRLTAAPRPIQRRESTPAERCRLRPAPARRSAPSHRRSAPRCVASRTAPGPRRLAVGVWGAAQRTCTRPKGEAVGHGCERLVTRCGSLWGGMRRARKRQPAGPVHRTVRQHPVRYAWRASGPGDAVSSFSRGRSMRPRCKSKRKDSSARSRSPSARRGRIIRSQRVCPFLRGAV